MVQVPLYINTGTDSLLRFIFILHDVSASVCTCIYTVALVLLSLSMNDKRFIAV